MRVLFLRGEWDERTEQSLIDDDDMWIQLVKETFDGGDVHFKNNPYQRDLDNNYDVVFSRGGFYWQLNMVEKHPNAKKIYYGAGRRFIPQDNIKYDLVLCDSMRQEESLGELGYNTYLFTKPAANCFKPHDVKKIYDVCFIANGQQADFKGVKWVYDTVPSDLKVLHLGYPSRYKPPKNVTTTRVKRIDMAKEISKCKIGIVPYFNDIDSCPRVVPEMLVCGLPLIVADQLHIDAIKYLSPNYGVVSREYFFWENVKYQLQNKTLDITPIDKLSVKTCAQKLRQVINDL